MIRYTKRCRYSNMINKVNGNESYDYTKLKMPDAADKTGDGEQFSLAYKRAQEETEEKDKSDKTEKTGISDSGAQRTVMQGGVKLELSGASHKVDNTNRENMQQTPLSVQGLVDTIRVWIASFVQSAKDLLYRIWNDPTPSEEIISQEEMQLQDEVTETDEPDNEAKRNEEIQKLLRSGDMEQVVNLVTENGQKTMAKNSTLLTYYDRSGKITPLSASDQERILHGDRNVKKL